MKKRKKQKMAAVILAAGQSTRMHSQIPKGLLSLGGIPLLAYLLRACQQYDEVFSEIAVVVSSAQKELFQKRLKPFLKSTPHVTWVEQPVALGTAHAVSCALKSSWGEQVSKTVSCFCIFPADVPGIQCDILKALTEPFKSKTLLRFVSCVMQNSFGYGRVVRRGKRGRVLKIVEEKDATSREKGIQEVATGLYCVRHSFLKTALRRMDCKNTQKEFYLPDLVQMASRRPDGVEAIKWSEETPFLGVNTPLDLARVQKIVFLRRAQAFALKGVRFFQIEQVWIEEGVEIEPDVEIGPQVILKGNTRIGQGSCVGMGCVLENVHVASNVTIGPYVVAKDTVIESQAHVVGPFVHLRPETEIKAGVRIGNFVELKKTSLGKETKVAHLSYLGNAQVGERVNIGCGFITCNYDGRVLSGKRKHSTVIEDDVFIGSDCQAVAPIRIKKGAYVASGSTLTKDVASESLAIARCRQVQKLGYAKKILNSSFKKTHDKTLTNAQETKKPLSK